MGRERKGCVDTDDFKDTVSKAAKGVAKTSGNFLKTAKLSINLNQEEENLKKVYLDIGKKVHEIYLYGGSLGKVFDEKYREIVECEGRIKDLRDRIGAVKGTKACPKCGKTIERDAEFCPKCGCNVCDAEGRNPESGAERADWRAGAGVTAEPLAAAPKPPVAEPTEPARVKCAACGAPAALEDRFCLYCGRMLR